MSSPKRFTNATGAPVADNTNILTAGPRGPALLQDIWLIEKMAHFDREVIPERRMHAKGWGAYGTFTVTHDITRYTRAKLFNKVGKATPVFLRFSTVAGERGAADAERDTRGFAVKFYTEEGNWDIVGNNTPVFFFRDPLRFSDLNHAIKRDPRTGLRSAQNNWDFWTLLPEALHQVTIVMSERGIPKSFRHMHGFGSHTFSMINAANARVWVKFHLRSQQGIENLSDADAASTVADDRESHGRDLLTAIESGTFPRWTLFIQVMTEAQARAHKHNPFDVTKVWPKADYPLLEVGVLELNRYPDNYFAEVEQAAFSPANVVPGISFSPDKMLQARLFSYGDTQRYRLGVNFNHIPVNAPRCPFMSYHRDGAMRTDGNLGGTLTYNPNSAGLWDNQPDFAEPSLRVEGDAAHWDYRVDDDHWEQPGNLFRMMTCAQQLALFENTARAMGDASLEVKRRHIENCRRADPAYGAGVAAALVSVAFGALTARAGLRPLYAMARAVSEIEAHDLSRRVGPAGMPREIARLAEAFNRMLDRLEAAFARERQFTADASHELRAPLTVIRATAEYALDTCRDGAEYRRALQSIGLEANDLELLVRDLLSAARADSTGAALGATADIGAAAFDAVEELYPLARARSIAVRRELPEDVRVTLEPQAATRIVRAILDNALRHARDGGEVCVAIQIGEREAALVISDDGAGFSEDALRHATERFWRDDPARQRGEGTGLGLAIAQSIAARAHGRLELQNGAVGGAVVRVTLPLAR